MVPFTRLLSIFIAQLLAMPMLFAQVAELNAPSGMTNYQWYKHTADGIITIENENSASINIAYPGVYFAEYEGNDCSPVTDYFILTPAGGMGTQLSLNAPEGDSYQWFANDTSLSGENNALLSLTATTDAITYYAEATHSSGKVTVTSAFTVMKPLDTDGDLVPDTIEDIEGTDSADTDSYLDSDGDGVPDYVEQYSSDEDNPCADGPPVFDCDGDGILNIFDDFPNDDDKAAKSYYPGENSMATLLFEDLWPFVGDYDFNDIAVNYRITIITNAQNQVVELGFELELVNNGGSFVNAFAFEIEGFDPANVASISGQQLSENLFSLDENGTESNQTNTVIGIFDNDAAVINQTIQVTVVMASPQVLVNIGTAPFDPFLIINGNREMEVHLIGEDPTDLGNSTPQVTGSNADPDGNYATDNGLPWAMNIVEQIKLPLEKEPINEGYLHFNEWAESGGTNKADWYLDKPGYRNTEKLKN